MSPSQKILRIRSKVRSLRQARKIMMRKRKKKMRREKKKKREEKVLGKAAVTQLEKVIKITTQVNL